MNDEGIARQSLEDLASFRDACDALLGNARRTVRILAPHLDLALLSREPVSRALAELTRISRFTEIHILFADSLLAMKHGHRLIELSRRFPSYISLKLLPADQRDQLEAWMVVDERHLLWRPSHHRYADGLLLPDEPERSAQLCRKFDEWWERAQPDPELRQLYL